MPEINITPLPQVAVIILAAGGSKRLGEPKQLLHYRQESLLERIVNSVLRLQDVMPAVVIGAQKELIASVLPAQGTIIINDQWEQGLATSITAGLSAMLQRNDQLQGCLFLVCDQPFLTTKLLQEILNTHHRTGKGIVAATYHKVTGTPVFFSRKYFDELLELINEEGAKKIVNKHLADLATVPFAEGVIDIDTQDDYKKLIHAD